MPFRRDIKRFNSFPETENRFLDYDQYGDRVGGTATKTIDVVGAIAALSHTFQFCVLRLLQVYLRGNSVLLEMVDGPVGRYAERGKESRELRSFGIRGRCVEHERRGRRQLLVHHRPVHLGFEVISLTTPSLGPQIRFRVRVLNIATDDNY